MDYYRVSIPIPKQPWQWIRFRIVTLLLIVAIIALALAWRHDHQQMAAQIVKLRNPQQSYAPMQATGPPNVTRRGDSHIAWCPATIDGGAEWLILEYDESIVPAAIVVHENYGPGAVTKVTHFPKFGREQTLWQGTYTPTQTSGGHSAALPVANGVKTNRIKVYLDTKAAADWNEIDAVGIQAKNGVVIWAARAEASSVWPQANTKLLQTNLDLIGGPILE